MELPRKRKDWLKIVAVVVAIIVAYQLIKRALPDVDAQKLLEDVSGSLGLVDVSDRRHPRLPRDRRVRRAGRAGRDGRRPRRRRRRPGRDLGRADDRHRLALAPSSATPAATSSATGSAATGCIRHGPRLRITPERFEQVEDYFAKHGGKTILIGRFIGLVRALAPFVAGSSRMPYRQLAPYSILGTGMWATLFTLLGYFASKNIDAVLSNSEHALLAFAVIVALIVGGIVAYRWLKVAGEPASGWRAGWRSGRCCATCWRSGAGCSRRRVSSSPG